MQTLAAQTVERMTRALDDDLNTAQAQAAIFEMVRQANAAFDTGGIKKDDVAPLLAALTKFDEIFAVLDDDDGPKMKRVLDWAMAEGREKDISEEAARSGSVRTTLRRRHRNEDCRNEGCPRSPRLQSL